MPPGDVVTVTGQAFEEVKSVHVEGSQVDKGDRMVINMTIGPDSARGKVSYFIDKKLISMEIIRNGERAFIRSEDLWRKMGGNKAAAQLGRRWTLMRKIDERIRFFSMNGMARMFKPESGSIMHARPTTVDGHPAVAVKQADGVTLYVAARGRPLPLKIGDAKGKNWITFSNYDAPFDTSDPPDYLDPSNTPGIRT